MILVVGGIKGGSGKTTICTNLAVLLAMQGKRVLLVDADEQKSSCDWAEQRVYVNQSSLAEIVTVALEGKSLYAQIKSMSKDYDHVLVDVGGRNTTSQRSALTCADYFLVPFKPRSIDIWTMGAVKTLVSEVLEMNPTLTCGFVINQADPKGSDNKQSYEVLSEYKEITCLPNFIVSRKAFSNAAADGLGVMEMINKDEKACKEIMELYESIYGSN